MASAISWAVRSAAASIVSGPISFTVATAPPTTAPRSKLPVAAPTGADRHQHARQHAAFGFDLGKAQICQSRIGHLIDLDQGAQLGSTGAKSDQHALQAVALVDGDKITLQEGIARRQGPGGLFTHRGDAHLV